MKLFWAHFKAEPLEEDLKLYISICKGEVIFREEGKYTAIQSDRQRRILTDRETGKGLIASFKGESLYQLAVKCNTQWLLW